MQGEHLRQLIFIRQEFRNAALQREGVELDDVDPVGSLPTLVTHVPLSSMIDWESISMFSRK